MGFKFSFKEIENRNELLKAMNFLSRQNIGYPCYNAWLERTEDETAAGYKKIVLAFYYDEIIGDCVYQPHKNIPLFIEIKNLRVIPPFCFRDIGRFMLKQIESETREKYHALIGDTRAEKTGIIKFLESYGFEPLCLSPLYEKDVLDITMVKWLNEKRANVLAPLVKNKIIAMSF